MNQSTHKENYCSIADEGKQLKSKVKIFEIFMKTTFKWIYIKK